MSVLYGFAVVYAAATLLGEPDIENYAMGVKVLWSAAVASPLLALTYVWKYSRKCR